MSSNYLDQYESLDAAYNAFATSRPGQNSTADESLCKNVDYQQRLLSEAMASSMAIFTNRAPREVSLTFFSFSAPFLHCRCR